MSKRYISIIISIFLLLFTLQAQAQKKDKNSLCRQQHHRRIPATEPLGRKLSGCASKIIR